MEVVRDPGVSFAGAHGPASHRSGTRDEFGDTSVHRQRVRGPCVYPSGDPVEDHEQLLGSACPSLPGLAVPQVHPLKPTPAGSLLWWASHLYTKTPTRGGGFSFGEGDLLKETRGVIPLLFQFSLPG